MINLLNEYELAFGVLPNEPDSNQVIYIENHKNKRLEWYIKGHLYKLKDLFSMYGLEFIYLPELVDCIDDEELIEAARYYAPWLKATDLQTLREACEISIEQLYGQVNLKDDVPAVVNSKGRAFKVDVKRRRDFGPLFSQIAQAYAIREEHEVVRYRFAEPDIKPVDYPQLHEDNQLFAEESQVLYQTITNPLDDEYAEADRMYLELRQKHPGWALKAILSAQLSKDEVISPIVINNPRNLILPEYNMEIHMAPATMAFYLLFLKHPEGIRFKDLIDYRNELYRLYNYTTKSDNKEKIANAVNVMVAQLEGNQDTQRSRIKDAIRTSFKSYICEDLAKWYYLDGKRGEPMKIAVAGEPGKVKFEIDI